jgi:hypothetical protein
VLDAAWQLIADCAGVVAGNVGAADEVAGELAFAVATVAALRREDFAPRPVHQVMLVQFARLVVA